MSNKNKQHSKNKKTTKEPEKIINFDSYSDDIDEMPFDPSMLNMFKETMLPDFSKEIKSMKTEIKKTIDNMDNTTFFYYISMLNTILNPDEDLFFDEEFDDD